MRARSLLMACTDSRDRRQYPALVRSAALALAAVVASSAVSPSDAQEAHNDAPPVNRLLLTTESLTFDEDNISHHTLQQGYQHDDERGAPKSALRHMIGDAPELASWDRPRMIVFAGGGDEALVWSPARNAERSQLTYRDNRVEMGDLHAGIGWEAQGATLSLGYIENDYRTPFGSQSESSASVSLAWRR